MNNVKGKALSALIWDLLGSFSQHGVGFVLSIFLARLLEPSDFGLIGMALVIINVFHVFTEFGFASALVQSRTNTSLSYSSVFFINVFSGLLLCGIFQFAAPFVALFYKQESIGVLVRWLSLSFVFSSFSIVQRTILRRNLQFKQLTIRTLVSQILGGLVGVVMAFKGYGVDALVAQNLIAAATGTIVLWSTSEWRPRLEFSFSEVRKLIGFSSYMFFDKIATAFFNQINTLFLGRYFSPSLVGYYSRAESLNNLVTEYSSNGITKVFFPVLSSVQNDQKVFFNIYYKVISVISLISFGLTGLLVLWGGDIITLLYGAKWQASILIFQILILRAFVYPVNQMMVNAFFSVGKSKENFWLGLFRRAAMLLPIAIGVIYSFNSFLIANVVVGYLMVISNVIFMAVFLKASVREHFIRIFVCAIPFVASIVLFFMFNFDSVIDKIWVSLTFLLFYIGFNYILKNDGLFFIWDNINVAYRKILNK